MKEYSRDHVYFYGDYYVSVYQSTRKFSEIYEYSGLYVYAYFASCHYVFKYNIYNAVSAFIYTGRFLITVYTCPFIWVYINGKIQSA